MTDYSTYTADDFVFDDSFRRWVRGSATLAEQAFWESYGIDHPEQAAILAQARQVVQALRANEPELSDAEVVATIQRTIERMEEVQPDVPVRPLPVRRWYQHPAVRVAAVLVVMLSLGWALWPTTRSVDRPITYLQLTRQDDQQLTEQHNETNQPQQLTLPDGSRVTLQPGSRLSYPARFATDTRTVYLTGDAFFDVVRNPRQPFLVHANELVTKVLGTSFRIRAYEQASETTVEVRTGQVSVSVRPGGITGKPKEQAWQGVVLTPNEKVVFSRPDARLTKMLVEEPAMLIDKPAEAAFAFTDAPVTEVFQALEKAYGVDIIYDREAMRHCLLTISLTDESLYDKLTIVCKAIEARYEILDAQIVVTGQGCQ
ncbi:anti-FecI sigma factor, FecR [Fibrisoma limi BUZ 3]|uniref:Anti-FecI sigma factor, FecR n=1 Tax=Fibrisoma limi BUZ 3 TaxID=1185876 RepID=I2GKH0_9BACT|nr:FecR family protein [Fibrisoma limi]CCH54395.1 anti-FecI sigma factor, FecR [Fibrisoma limi BUZ 3]